MIFEYDTIILGSSIDALFAAAQKKSPAIFSDFRIPFRFDYIEPDVDLSFLNLPHTMAPKSLTTPNGEMRVGVPKYIVWERLMFLLSMAGHAPLSNLCNSMRIDDHTITCFNDYSKIAEIRFNKCIYYGDSNVSGLSFKKSSTNPQYLCYDWIAFNRGGKHDIDHIETLDNFVKHVWFYPSDRIDGNTGVKDACVVSLLNEEQLADFDYSETTARFKLLHEMESRGMRGLFNGIGPNGKPKYYKFKTTHLYREKCRFDEIARSNIKGLHIAQADNQVAYEDLPQICLDYGRFLKGA